MVTNKKLGSLVFQVLNYTVLGAYALVSVLPFLHVIVSSVADTAQLSRGGLLFWPENPTWSAYGQIFSTPAIPKALLASVIITTLGTLVCLAMTTTMAYPLAQQRFRSKGFFMMMVTVTLVFDGGMIPTFMVVRSLGLIDSLWALILPVAIAPSWLIVMRSFIQSIPDELQEAAHLEGADDAHIFWHIILPLSKAALATFVVMYGVMHWNSWFSAMIYLNSSDWMPIQVVLRQIVLSAQGAGLDSIAEQTISPMGMRMAVVVVATLPIMLIYPFLQKYFVQGMMLGSVKG